jgi:hypothetical protein
MHRIVLEEAATSIVIKVALEHWLDGMPQGGRVATYQAEKEQEDDR